MKFEAFDLDSHSRGRFAGFFIAHCALDGQPEFIMKPSGELGIDSFHSRIWSSV